MSTNLTLTTAYLANLQNTQFDGLFVQILDYLASDILQIALGSGLATLSSGLTNGTAYTSIGTSALFAGVTAGQSLTIVYGVHTQIVTVTSNASVGATSVSVSSFTANFSYPSSTSCLTTTPLTSNTQLDHEQLRVPYSLGSGGVAIGEQDWTVYFSPNQANSFVIAELGIFDDNSSNVANSGILMARAPYSLGTGQKTALQSLQFKVSMIPTSTY